VCVEGFQVRLGGERNRAAIAEVGKMLFGSCYSCCRPVSRVRCIDIIEDRR